ncbi:MAG TPA: glutamine amidotransferase [Candidatus Competibacteraceae bacterium]|nr:glutamine amidotransferase [Candidatus Competibacteraceae bacterium]
MPPRILLILQDPEASAGRIGVKLAARGYALEARCPLAGDALPAEPADYAGAVIFGGPMSANDDLPGLRAQLQWIPRLLDAGTPFLGICLGAQLLARALGAEVRPHPAGQAEIGYYAIRPTTAGQAFFPDPLRVYHWHMEGFQLPHGAELLARSDDFPHQAFRYGERAFGLQFHPEVTRDILEEWCQVAAHHLRLPGAQDVAQQRLGHRRYDAALDAWLDGFLARWLEPLVA